MNWHEDFGDEPGIEECFEEMDVYEAQRQIENSENSDS